MDNKMGEDKLRQHGFVQRKTIDYIIKRMKSVIRVKGTRDKERQTNISEYNKKIFN